MRQHVFRAAALAVALSWCASPAGAQFGGLKLGDLAKRAGITAPSLRKEPISTSLSDARWADPTQDNFVPPSPKRELTQLQRTAAGGFVLQAGYYRFHDQSYCLHAGTHGPGGGDGYLYAPPLGSAKDAVISIVRGSVQHPEIDQHVIQSLLWAILSRAKIEDLAGDQRMAAAQLLTPKQLAGLNRNVLDMLSAGPIADNLPREVRAVMQAEADLRRMLTTPGTSFSELERVAVLAGMAPAGPGSIGVPTGRWSHHPDGYWIRYLPNSYSNTVVEIWVPEGAPGIGQEYDPATHIAVPGNTSRQRLIQSGRPFRND
ncbi:hypothetical protein [Sphingomonas phyllosphaerae]|uniref:hypothetical protein n=1 Tax=Sphingomonas phyllosphaerae TaxID=257003 RepID=UPI0012DCF888|nr:hypothetical protein [Sphingomonas phyllosphaerae]